MVLQEMYDIACDKIRIFDGKSDLIEYDVFRIQTLRAVFISALILSSVRSYAPAGTVLCR